MVNPGYISGFHKYLNPKTILEIRYSRYSLLASDIKDFGHTVSSCAAKNWLDEMLESESM